MLMDNSFREGLRSPSHFFLCLVRRLQCDFVCLVCVVGLVRVVRGFRGPAFIKADHETHEPHEKEHETKKGLTNAFLIKSYLLPASVHLIGLPCFRRFSQVSKPCLLVQRKLPARPKKYLHPTGDRTFPNPSQPTAKGSDSYLEFVCLSISVIRTWSESLSGEALSN